MKQQIYYINPVSKPRMTQRDVWKKRPVVVKYHAFCDEMRASRLSLCLNHGARRNALR